MMRVVAAFVHVVQGSHVGTAGVRRAAVLKRRQPIRTVSAVRAADHRVIPVHVLVVGHFERHRPEERMVQELLARPPLTRVLVQAPLGEVDAFAAHELFGQFAIDGVEHARVGDAQAAKELVSLKDLHVPLDEVAEVLSDQVELVDV